MRNIDQSPSYIHFTGKNSQDFTLSYPPVEFSTYNTIREALLKEIARTTRLEKELKALKEKYNE